MYLYLFIHSLQEPVIAYSRFLKGEVLVSAKCIYSLIKYFLSYTSKHLPERKEVRITEQCLDESLRQTRHIKRPSGSGSSCCSPYLCWRF